LPAATGSADSIARGVLADGAARVVALIATDVAREAASRHGTTGLASVALGRAATAGLLLATLTKDDERVTLQLLGDGPLGSLTVDAQSSGRVRVFVKNPLADTREPAPRPGHHRASLGGSLGRHGQVTVVRDVGLREPFRGQTSFAHGEVDDDVERYLIDSEQIDSAVACEVFCDERGGVSFAAGLLIQALPGSEGSPLVEAARTSLHAGAFTRVLAQALAPSAPAPTAESLAERLVAELGDGEAIAVSWLDRRPVVFHCPCSKERAAATLALLDESELTHMLATNEQGQVTCNFCRRTYTFPEDELDAIRAEVRKKADERS